MRSHRTTAATIVLLVAAGAQAGDAPPLFEGLGNHGRKVVTGKTPPPGGVFLCAPSMGALLRV